MQGGWFSGKEWFICFRAISGSDLVAEMLDRDVAMTLRSHAGRVV